jgi:uncharacterized membrane protein YGL010W
MNSYFRRQLAEYADYHRDDVNRWMHIIGNPIIALAVFLPLSLVSVPIFGVHVTAAALLVIPALIVWMAFDFGLGLAVVISAIPLLLAAAVIAKNVSVVWLWIITVLLVVIGWVMQVVGHQLFERRKPALLDNPIHMLMSPMYIFAKLYIALGFRPDLAAVLGKLPEPAPLFRSDGSADLGQQP